jgi:hypothetical protein
MGISAPAAKAELVMANTALLASGGGSGLGAISSGGGFCSGSAGWAQPAIAKDVNSNKLIKIRPSFHIF